MTKNITFFYFFLLTNLLLAQKTWIVDVSKQRSSFSGVRIDKVELNEKNTVVHMSFRNIEFVDQHIEACNTFHIRSNGKKIARFVRAENIPTRDTKREGFACADIERAMRIRPGQFVRFRVVFTRIPENLNQIDVIEYNGTMECEFDVYNLNISSKMPLPPSQAIAATKSPSAPVAKPKPNVTASTPKPNTQKPKPKPVEPTTPPPTIAENAPPKPTATPSVSEPKFEQRVVNVRKTYPTNMKTLRLEIWDNDQEDGDIISVMLNGRLIVKNYAVRKNRRKLEIPLQEGENVLTFHAENLGQAPPNTAALSFFDGIDQQTIILNANMDKSEAIKIIKN